MTAKIKHQFASIATLQLCAPFDDKLRGDKEAADAALDKAIADVLKANPRVRLMTAATIGIRKVPAQENGPGVAVSEAAASVAPEVERVDQERVDTFAASKAAASAIAKGDDLTLPTFLDRQVANKSAAE